MSQSGQFLSSDVAAKQNNSVVSPLWPSFFLGSPGSNVSPLTNRHTSSHDTLRFTNKETFPKKMAPVISELIAYMNHSSQRGHFQNKHKLQKL